MIAWLCVLVVAPGFVAVASAFGWNQKADELFVTVKDALKIN